MSDWSRATRPEVTRGPTTVDSHTTYSEYDPVIQKQLTVNMTLSYKSNVQWIWSCYSSATYSEYDPVIQEQHFNVKEQPGEDMLK